MTKRTSVSMPEGVYKAALKQMKDYDFSEFSDYVQALIRADTGFGPVCSGNTPEDKPPPPAKSNSQKGNPAETLLGAIENVKNRRRPKQ